MLIFRTYSPWSILLAVCMLAALLLLTGPQKTVHAAAATHALSATYCTGSPPCGIDNTDPYQTGCAGGSASWGVLQTVNLVDGNPNDFSSPTTVGYAQLWYSWTCNTNWARVVSTTQYGVPNLPPNTSHTLEAWVGIWQNNTAQLPALGYNSCQSCTEVITPQFYIPTPAYAYGGVRPYGMAIESYNVAHQ